MSKFINVLDVAVGNTVPAASATALTLSSTVPAAGQIIPIVAKGGTGVVVGSSTFTSAVTDFYFASRDAAGYPRLSLPINGKSIVRVTKQAYAAATAQVSTVTLAAADVVAGNQVTFYIVDLADEEYVNKPRYRYSLVASAGETIATLATKFVDLIKADTAAIVTASSAAGVITLTGKADKTRLASSFSFAVIPYQSLTTASVATTTKADPGAGTPSIVFDIEEKYKGYKGNMNRSEYVVLPNYQTDSSKTYTTYVIEHKQPVDDLTLGATKGLSVETYVFVDSAGTVANLEAVFTALGIAITNA